MTQNTMLSFVERIRNLESLGEGKSGRIQHEMVVKTVKRVLRRMVEIMNRLDEGRPASSGSTQSSYMQTRSFYTCLPAQRKVYYKEYGIYKPELQGSLSETLDNDINSKM